MIAGAVKGFGITFEEALYDISYTNLILYGATLPSYHSKGKDGEENINGDDPANNQKLRNLIESLS